MLNILTPLYRVNRLEFKVASTYSTPTSASCFEQGQWAMLDSSNANYVIPADGSTKSFLVWSKKGESSVQALGQITILQGILEADTDQFKVDESYTIGGALEVSNGKLAPYDAGIIVAYTVLPPDQNNNMLRFVTIA